VAKYFAIIPAMFVASYPQLDRSTSCGWARPESAILSAVIFNALIIVALIPLALRGVKFRAVGAAEVLRRNLLDLRLGGIIAPFVGIKLIDLGAASVGSNLGPDQPRAARRGRRARRRLPRAENGLDDRCRRPGRRGHRVRLGPRPAHLPGQRPAAGAPGGGGPRPRRPRSSRSDRRRTRSAGARRARRATASTSSSSTWRSSSREGR
jgi:hypothetical protein